MSALRPVSLAAVMSEPFDVIVVGGGHNGLVAAGLLAKRGARVTVLERRATVGGAATTEQPWGPAFKMSALSYVVSLIPPEIVRELDLARHGYKIYPQNGYFVPVPRRPRRCNSPTTIPRAGTRRSRSSRAPTPTRSRAGTRGSAASADVLGPLLETIPPALGSLQPARPRRPGAPRVDAAPARRARASAT